MEGQPSPAQSVSPCDRQRLPGTSAPSRQPHTSCAATHAHRRHHLARYSISKRRQIACCRHPLHRHPSPANSAAWLSPHRNPARRSAPGPLPCAIEATSEAAARGQAAAKRSRRQLLLHSPLRRPVRPAWHPHQLPRLGEVDGKLVFSFRLGSAPNGRPPWCLVEPHRRSASDAF